MCFFSLAQNTGRVPRDVIASVKLAVRERRSGRIRMGQKYLILLPRHWKNKKKIITRLLPVVYHTSVIIPLLLLTFYFLIIPITTPVRSIHKLHPLSKVSLHHSLRCCLTKRAFLSPRQFRCLVPPPNTGYWMGTRIATTDCKVEQ